MYLIIFKNSKNKYFNTSVNVLVVKAIAECLLKINQVIGASMAMDNKTNLSIEY